MRPRQCAVAGVYDGLYRARLVDDHEAPGRIRDVVRGHRLGKRTRPPVAERALHLGESLFGRDVSDNGKHRVVRQVVRAMERDQVGARDGTDRPRRAALRQAVGMEAVHEPVEDHAGDVGRIVVADPQAGQDLVALPLDLGLRKGRPPRDVGEQVEREVEAVLHHEDVDEPEVARRAHAQRAADAVDGAGDLLGGARCRPLVEKLPDERGDTRLAGRVRRGAGAQDHAHIHRGLLVIADIDDLQPVVQGADLVVRKIDVAPQERRRRLLGRPVDSLRRGRRCNRGPCEKRGEPSHRTPPAIHPLRPHHCPVRREPRGRIVNTRRLSSRR